jgi:hypothetical protein
MTVQPFVGPWLLFSVSLSFYTVGRTPWTGDQNKHTQISMSQVGFEPTIPVFERAKTVHALDLVAAVIGHFPVYRHRYLPVSSQIYETQSHE